jgi:hypothetical protein
MLNLMIGRGCGPTGRLLSGLLRERGINIGERGQGVICYGVGYGGNLPALNKMAGRYNKYTQFEMLLRAGVRTPKFFNRAAIPQNFAGWQFPLFGRNLAHREGKDICLALQPEDIPLRFAAGIDFFTEFVPRQTEIRVWIYRRRHLASYQKVMRHPQQYRYYGCSYRNGFAFELMNAAAINRDAVDQAAKAVDALGLDFGAVDVMIGKDGNAYVLEINTAPGVEAARQGITGLADKIATWEKAGMLRRNGEVRG